MKIWVVTELVKELNTLNKPQFNTFSFSTKQKAEEFMNTWLEERIALGWGIDPDDSFTLYYGTWSYDLSYQETELDNPYVYTNR